MGTYGFHHQTNTDGSGKLNQVMVDDSATIRVPVETPHSQLGDLSLKFWAGTLLILVELNIQKIPFLLFDLVFVLFS